MTQTTEKRQTKKKQTEKRQTGYVYALRSYQTDDIYIGSTLGTLRQRLYKHKYDLKQFNNGKYHYVTSYEIVKYDDAFIEMIEKYENVNKMELRKYEGHTIRNTKCVNKRIEGSRSKEEMKEYQKEYYEINYDKIKEYQKEYREINNDKMKEYREINKDKIKEYREINNDKIKEYREINKDKLKEQQKEYYETHKEQKKEYQLINKDKIKEYREINNDKIKEQRKAYNESQKAQKKIYNKEYYILMKQKLKTAIFGEMILN